MLTLRDTSSSSDTGNPQLRTLNNSPCDEPFSETVTNAYNFPPETRKYLETFLELLSECSPEKEETVKEMNRIADSLDRLEKRTTIASVTSSSFGILGGITTIVGVALAPVTLGASLIVTVVGIGVATTAGAAGLSATAAKHILSHKNYKKVQAMKEKIIKKVEEIQECLKAIDRVTRRIAQIPCVSGDQRIALRASTMAGRSIYTATEIGRLAPLFKVSASAARGIRVAGAVSGVLAGIFLVVDAAFIVKGSIDLHMGAKSNMAEKIRTDIKSLEQTFQELQDIGKDLYSCIMETR